MRAVLLLAAVGCFLACPLSSAVAQPSVLPGAEPSPGEGALTISPEYVFWWLREGRVPALLTTSSPASAGVLGQPDTHILYGDGRIPTRHGDQFNGARLALEWMNAADTVGIEARGFALERDSTYFSIRSSGDVVLAQPYFNPLTGQPESRLVAGNDPRRGLLSGAFAGYSRIEWFGEEVNALLPLAVESNWRVDLLTGARFFQMRDRFNDTTSSRSEPDGATLWGETDNVRVGTAFYGGQVGVRSEYGYGRFFIQMRGTIALGGDDERVRTFGQAVYATPQTRTVTPVGLYVQPSNSGQFTRRNFDGAGEAAFNVGCQLTRHVRLLVGYTFLYWADPLRAGDQVDTLVNRLQTTTPAPARPTTLFKGDALWVQGVNVGLEVKW